MYPLFIVGLCRGPVLETAILLSFLQYGDRVWYHKKTLYGPS